MRTIPYLYDIIRNQFLAIQEMVDVHQATTMNPPRVYMPSALAPFTDTSTPQDIAQQWLERFSKIISSGKLSLLYNVIRGDCWWRDHCAITWDLRTVFGLDTISRYLATGQGDPILSNFRLVEEGNFKPSLKNPTNDSEWIEAMFTFETAVGRGKGILRLASEEDGTVKALMIYTALQELKGHEPRIASRRPHGGDNSLNEGLRKENWAECHQRRAEFKESDPDVLIIGAGQAGLNLGARLQTMGLSCLLIDKNDCVGDNWRNRYRTLVTHDPVHYNHMTYMPFPSTWPLFTPKDKLADWLESYSKAMDLNVWMKTHLQNAQYHEEAQSWTVELRRHDDSARSLKAKHIVLCTGLSGEPKVPRFNGQATFKGAVYHGSQHQDASHLPDMKGKHVVVIGTGNSGHDIAQNYYEHGAKVCMVQRGGTYVISAKRGLFMLHEGLYEENGPPTEDADIYGQSLPIPVQLALNARLTDRIAEADQETLCGLERVGFKLDFGEGRSGIYQKYIVRGGGYYIDVGASQLIIDGKIQVVQSPDGIKGFGPDGLVLADGRALTADVVVLATGYDSMRTTLRKVLGDTVADRCKDVWGLDEEGEVNAVWRPSGHPRLWYMGGSLALCRTYSSFLALQIKAAELGSNGD